MPNSISPIIEAHELLPLLSQKNTVIVDASNSPTARQDYEKEHIEKALFVDINTQLAFIKENLADGGRHPLPTFEQFSETLYNLGIAPDTHVIVYDRSFGANAAARFWWMLRAIGHEKVQVLSGGLQEAIKKSLPISSGQETVQKQSRYEVKKWNLSVVSLEEVKHASADPTYTIIDVRENRRYRGEIEPIDKIAGHIPNALNVPFQENLQENGLFQDKNFLKNKYTTLFEGQDQRKIIVHCGSGVTACHTLLAIAYADLEIPNLYVGSWSEWSRNGLEIAVESA